MSVRCFCGCFCGCFFRASGSCPGSLPAWPAPSCDPSGWKRPGGDMLQDMFVLVVLVLLACCTGATASCSCLARVQLLPVRLMCPDPSSTSAAPFRCGLSGSCPAVPGLPDPFACGLLLCANFAILCGCSFRLAGILQGCPILSGSIDGSGRPVPDPRTWPAGCTGATPTPSHAHTLAREKALFSEFILNKCAAWVWPFFIFRASLYRGLCAVFRACCPFAVPSRLCSSCQLLPFLLALSNAIYTQSKRYKSTIKA